MYKYSPSCLPTYLPTYHILPQCNIVNIFVHYFYLSAFRLPQNRWQGASAGPPPKPGAETCTPDTASGISTQGDTSILTPRKHHQNQEILNVLICFDMTLHSTDINVCIDILYTVNTLISVTVNRLDMIRWSKCINMHFLWSLPNPHSVMAVPPSKVPNGWNSKQPVVAGWRLSLRISL